MGKLVLNAGSANNDKTGDTLRAGALKIRANFDEIYAALANDGVNISGGNVLKTGNYQDLSNKPVFATVATSGDFYDLTDRPDIGIFVGAPANAEGSDGHVAGNLAFDGNNLYVCREDYLQQDEFTGFTSPVDAAGEVVYPLEANSTSTGTTVELVKDIASAIPSVGWQIGDGATTRSITDVSVVGDVITLTLDGAFTATSGVSYHIIYSVGSGQHVVVVPWDAEAYQDLYDQFEVDEKPAKLYIDLDGYGRQVNDIILNSVDDELYIVYTAGSTIGDFTGLKFRFNQPEIWKSLPWASIYGGGSVGGGTGDVTFVDNVVEGTGFALALSPGPDFTTGDFTAAPGPELGPQYFRVRGGDNYEHLHFDTSDNSLFDLYVGDDSKYFKLSKDGHAVIGVGGPTWTFGTDGTIQFPSIQTNLHNGGNQFAQTLKFGIPGQQVVITGPTPEENYNAERIIIQGQRATGMGEGGDVYFWGGDADVNGGDIKIYAGDADDATTGYGGYVNIDGGYGYDQGGDIHISGGNSTLAGGSVTLTAGGGTTNGLIYLQTYGNNWTLDSNGVLTLPVGGDINDSSGNSVLYTGPRFVESPASSVGQIGDLQGDIAFNNSYMYYCTADYGQVGHQVVVATLYNGATSANTNMFQLTKTTDTEQITVGDIISDSNGGPTSTVVSVSSDSNYTYVGTGSFAYSCVFPLTFTSTDPAYVSGGNIWKRVAFSNDTW